MYLSILSLKKHSDLGGFEKTSATNSGKMF